jgi:hypothetical protein
MKEPSMVAPPDGMRPRTLQLAAGKRCVEPLMAEMAGAVVAYVAFIMERSRRFFDVLYFL